MLANRLPHSAPDTIAHDRWSHSTPDSETHSWRRCLPCSVCVPRLRSLKAGLAAISLSLCLGPSPQKEDCQIAGEVPASRFVNLFKIGMLQKPYRFGKTVAGRHRTCDYSRKPGFTLTRLRRLARRRESTVLPPWVFIRLRKPCFLERRRRFGWNVRFGIGTWLLLD